MTDTLISTLIGSGITLIVAVVTSLSSTHIEMYKNKEKVKQQEYQMKRENLHNVYMELIKIVNLYPTTSPNDILKWVKYPPNYSMEGFNSTIRSLDCMLDDYKKTLKTKSISIEDKKEIEKEVYNIEYSKKQIFNIRDMYFDAQEKYNEFSKNQKYQFELYANQEVRNQLVEFEAVIHNVFISGKIAGDKDDPINNIIEVARRNLINSMRNDMGIE